MKGKSRTSGLQFVSWCYLEDLGRVVMVFGTCYPEGGSDPDEPREWIWEEMNAITSSTLPLTDKDTGTIEETLLRAFGEWEQAGEKRQLVSGREA